MFKIVLADDEPVIIKGLRKMIQWEALHAEIVAEAGNGEELLEKVREFSPDIVISDVAMPRMSGLDVIKKIREYDKKTKIIFLSGYQEFDYVRTAIRYDAQEYLLKPVGKEELEQAVLRAEQALKSDSPMEYWREETNDMQTVFRKMNTDTEYKELYQHFKDMGIQTEGMAFTGVCFSLPPGFHKEIGNQDMEELLRFSIFKRIQEFVKKERIGFVIKREVNSSNLILVNPIDTFRVLAEEEIEAVRNTIWQVNKVRLIAGLGNTVFHIKELKYAYKTAKFCSELHYFSREEFIRYEDVSRDFKCSFEDYNNQYKELVASIFGRDAMWKEKLGQVLKIIENLHYGNRYAAENRCIAMAMDLYKELEEYHIVSSEARQEYETFVAKIRLQPGYRELESFITRFLGKFLEKNAFQDSGAENSAIHQVKEYIREHYAEDLSLGKMAEIVYMNPYYFSSFFKKETGQNYKNYLAEVRMKEAVKLLMKTDMKTYELAKAVGYNDVRSFTEKFREYFGDSPSGYKKSRK